MIWSPISIVKIKVIYNISCRRLVKALTVEIRNVKVLTSTNRTTPFMNHISTKILNILYILPYIFVSVSEY